MMKLIMKGMAGFSFLVMVCSMTDPATAVARESSVEEDGITLFPASGAVRVNPDTPLRITFSQKPVLGTSGAIRIYDASDSSLVDLLDLSIPPGPKNSRMPAPYDSLVYEKEVQFIKETTTEEGNRFIPVPLEDIYQHTYIGGQLESDIYHFFPVLIHDNVAIISLHHHVLEHGKSYYVIIDPEVFTTGDHSSLWMTGEVDWVFTTRPSPPSPEKECYIVSGDGTGDFNTVLGAIESVPDRNPSRKTIFIKNGVYEEIVYFRDKENITIVGESRDGVRICYANNGSFNPRPTGPREEMIERFRNRRSVFAVHNSNGIQLANLTIQSLGEKPAQAESLLVIGERNIVSNVTMIGSGDALQATGTIYMDHSSITGFGDNVLGYGSVYFNECDLVSTYGPHMWVRNTQEDHGNVFRNCTFSTLGEVETVIARAPSSPDYSFPYAEAVLINCAMEGIRPEGWGQVGEDRSHIRYWEYNSVQLEDEIPVDVSRRVPYSRQLTMELDSVVITQYSTPSFILKGWTPQPDTPIACPSDTVRVIAE